MMIMVMVVGISTSKVIYELYNIIWYDGSLVSCCL